MLTIRASKQPSDTELGQIRALCQRAEAHDKVFPLNEEAQLSPNCGRHILVSTTGLVGYAWLGSDHSAQIVVDPLWRRQQVATSLLIQLRTLDPEVELWSFGDLPSAREFCHTAGFATQRELLVMQATLNSAPSPIPVPGVRLEEFSLKYLDELVGLNARVFAGHPEQGQLTIRDFQARMASDWFDPNDLLMALDKGDVMIGFIWAKVESSDAELYVLGVDPLQASRGVGRLLLQTGLANLFAQSVDNVRLWVEADNFAARSLYEITGFSIVRRDFRYRSTP